MVDDLDKTEKQLEKLGDTIGKIARNYNKPLDILVDKFASMGGKGKVLAGVFAAVGVAISTATQASKEFYKSLNSIRGISGDIGNFAKTLTKAAGGSVSRQELADFYSSTSKLFVGVEAMTQMTGYAKDLISLYGDVNTAVDAFNNSLLLSVESQAQYADYVKEASALWESTSWGKIETLKNDIEALVATIGNDLLYVLQPLLEIVSKITSRIRELRSGSGSLGLSEAEYYTELQKVAEKYGVTLEELNEIQRAQQANFTSSLDEVKDTGLGVMGLTPEGIESVNSGLEETLGMTEDLRVFSEDSTEWLDGALDIFFELVDIVKELTSALEGPLGVLLKWVAALLKVIGGFVSWLNEAEMLFPVLVGIAGALGLAMMAKGSWVRGGLIVAGAIALGLAGISNPSDSGSSESENNYEGVGNDISNNSAGDVYLDATKVNEATERAKKTSDGSWGVG